MTPGPRKLYQIIKTRLSCRPVVWATDGSEDAIRALTCARWVCVLGALAIAAAGVLAPGSSAKLAPPAHAAATTTASRLIAIRASHHPGFDRLVFEFSGPPPSRQHVRYVNQLIADPSGRSIPVAGRSILAASFFPATARGAATSVAVPERLVFALPNVMTVVRAGEFESVLSYGIGLAKRTTFHVFTLTRPSRVVVDIDTPFQTVLKKVYFENLPRFAAGTQPYVTAVVRPVLPAAPATGVMDRLFAGPTDAEAASDLRLQQSRATGFTGLSITGLVARVRLTGGCSSGGSTFTIADAVYPTLKQFATVDFVKIYDPAGHTESPSGTNDSIPVCLEP